MESDPPKNVVEYNFKTALVDFQHLKQQNSLPQKMSIKLQYLQNKILGRPIIIDQYKQLPEYQLQSLQQCDKQSQTLLFLSIVKCLSGKQVIVYFTNAKAYIKKQETFSIWNKCYISCDSAYLYVKKKATKKTNYYQFKIRLLKVSKKYLEYKGKLCFGIMYDNKKYMLGFQLETACDRIFKTLKQLAKENQPLKIQQKAISNLKNQPLLFEKQQKNDKHQLPLNTNPQHHQNLNKNSSQNHLNLKNNTNLRQSISSKLSQNSASVLQFEQDEQQEEINLKQVKEAEISQAIKQQIKRQNISSDASFKLIKNFELGRLLVYNGPNQGQLKQSKTKTAMILSLKQSKVDYSWLLQQYLSMKSWNLEIEQSKIIHKISQNSFKVYLQFKKYSMLSLTRWAIVIATGIVVEKKVYLLIRSCEQLTEEQMVLGNYMSTVRMKKFDQTVEICQRSQNDDKVLMTIITSADFGGYCSKADNFNMSMHILNNVQNFYSFLLSQAISIGTDENKIPLFELNPVFPQILIQTPTKSQSRFTESSMSRSEISTIPKRKQSYNSSEMDDEDVDNVFEQEQKPIQFDKKSKFMMKSQEPYPQIKISLSSRQVQEMLFKEFIKEFETLQVTDRGTDKLVKFVESKVHQKYYLKHKFIQHQKYDPSAQKHNDDPVSDNWLIQKGMWRISGLELIFTNEQILAQQKNVIKLILKQLSSNVMAGKNIMNMSLPVEIFENKSFLQKLGEVYGFFPYYFNLAAKQKNITKQITYVTQAIAYATTICPNIEKPFNPIIGETYQCNIGGVSLSFEQTSHHPPISSFYFRTDEYECYGNHNPLVQMGLNTAVARNTDPIFVHFFETNTKYSGYGQDFQIGGLLFGQRTYKNSGKVNVFEEKNQILCELSYGKNKKNIYESPKKLKTGEIIGGVFRVSNGFTKRFRQVQWKTFEGIKYDQKIEQLARISGNWMGDFYVDGVKMRGMYDILPSKPVKDIMVLPSDCSFRLDVFYKKMGDIKKAQEWKEVMENQQRKDRKLREENDKDHSRKH